jgi:hypothetical protein
MLRRGAMHAEEKSTEQESYQDILNGVRHNPLMEGQGVSILHQGLSGADWLRSVLKE